MPIEQGRYNRTKEKENLDKNGRRVQRSQISKLLFFFLSFCEINRKGSYKSSLNLEKLFCLNIGKHSLKHQQIKYY